MSPLNTVIVPVLCAWDVEADLAAVPLARREVAQLVRSWGVPITDNEARDVELCSDELLANAVEHTGDQCRVTVRWTGVRLRVEVSDSSPKPPGRGTADDTATNGRGLLLVEALAHSWGWYPVETGKVVWFEAAPDQISDGRGAARRTGLHDSCSGTAVGANPQECAGDRGRPATTPSTSSRYEIRAIDSQSPHFILLECWGIYDREQHEYVRVPGSSDRIRRFYTVSAAERHLRYSGI
ncbi:ATP-binding protein [Kitasatospora sp. NPDC058190]|uniref:ATP-binding protein n=1 Tax=Kitasatospora sp. NPDC058190 TaxID=3346371 RepID=UPI0036DE34E1